MHFRRFVLLTISFFLIVASRGQSIEGIVLNSETKEAVSFCNVFVKELHTGTRCDSMGYFRLDNLTTNKLSLELSALGYLPKYIQINASLKNQKLSILMDPHHVELSEVIVSRPTGKLIGDNIVMVGKKDLSELNRNAQNSLMESISQIAGVDNISTGTSIGKPVIRGLTGNRVVTYAQGMRIENQQWGSEHGLGIGEVGIGSVEIIKGPASLLYGSDAIGGVLYFTDETYAKVNSVDGNVSSTYLSNSLTFQNNVGVRIHRGKYKQNIFAAYNSSADYMVPKGQRVVNTRFDEKNFKTSLGYNNKFWVTNLRYSYLLNNFGITEADSLYHTPTDRTSELPYQEVADHKISSENVFFIKRSKVDLTLGYSNNQRKEFEDSKENASLNMVLATSTYNFKLHFPLRNEDHKLIFGFQGMYQTNSNFGEEVLIPDALTLDNGIYALWTGTFNKIDIEAGMRADERRLNGLKTSVDGIDVFDPIDRIYSNLNYSLGAKYAVNNNVFRLNVSTGFRAPNTSELLSMGEHEGTNRYEIGDDNLKSENASQLDISYAYKDEHIEFSINPFINSIQNYIFINPTDSFVDGSQVYYYSQINSILAGGEVNLHIHPHNIHWMHFETAFSTVSGIDEENNYLPLMPANNFNSTLKAEFKDKRKFYLSEIFIQHVYKFDQNMVAQYETASSEYQLFSLGLIAKCTCKKIDLQFKAGVNNIFNTTYIDHLSRLKIYNVPGQGRNVYVGMRIGV